MSETLSFGERVRKALIWRSGTQILAQLISWGSTLAVIRILDPSDYGLFAMTQVVLVFLSFLNGYGLASSIIQNEEVDPHRLRQAFGALLLLNGGLAASQFLLAPWIAEFYGQPIIADLLRVQALIFLATPFIVLPEAVLARELEFKKTALINLLSAVVGAIVALGCALSGLGVWTLVYAALAIFWTQGIGLFLSARMFIWPSFNFRGSKDMFTFGGTILLAHVLWTVQSQSDIFIGSQTLTTYELGLYAEALFLTTILAAKFIPPLNEVAFPAYSRMQSDPHAVRRAFLKAVRIIMMVACPFYLGMAVTAQELVHVVLGEKWLPMVPIVSVMALVMPLMTLQILFAPLNNAMGHPEISLRTTFVGAVVMSFGFWVGSQFGVMGLAYAWVGGFPLVTIATILLSKRQLQLPILELVQSIWPGLIAAVIMACAVLFAKAVLPPLPVLASLPIYVLLGACVYAGILYGLAKPALIELFQLAFRRKLNDLAPSDGR
ncbi:MAG: lipopolysaccharide biosynthesis protein [Erythrobacter sp.]|uniref:lipopolysaccharide biosynthesis protein n=1 Tax=Erythrobacter sp. TaxID=1042 RepID=UPI0032976CCF